MNRNPGVENVTLEDSFEDDLVQRWHKGEGYGEGSGTGKSSGDGYGRGYGSGEPCEGGTPTFAGVYANGCTYDGYDDGFFNGYGFGHGSGCTDGTSLMWEG